MKFTFHLTQDQIMVIDHALQGIAFRQAAPILAELNRQLAPQQKPVEVPKVEDVPEAAATNASA